MTTDLDKRPNLLAGLKDGAWLDAQTFAPLRYSVPGLIPEGLTLLVGAPKIGKSNFMLALGLACASKDGMALGAIDVGETRPVLYLALEDGDRRLQDRCRRLLYGEPIPSPFKYITQLEQPGMALETINEWLDHLEPEHPAYRAPLVILDTVGKVMPPAAYGEAAYQRDYRLGGSLKRLADDHPGMSFVAAHHNRKAASEDFVDSANATQGLAGACDTIVVLARKRHETNGRIMVTGRDVREGEYAVHFTDGTHWTLDGNTLDEAATRVTETRAAAHLGDRSRDIFDFVNEHPDGVTAPQVNEALDLDDARVYLARLVDTDRIQRLKRGLYGPLCNALTTVTNDNVLPLTRNTCNARIAGDPPNGAAE